MWATPANLIGQRVSDSFRAKTLPTSMRAAKSSTSAGFDDDASRPHS